jgi:cytochrome P450
MTTDVGEHFCLGAALARMEGRIAFEEILARFTGIDLAGPCERLASLIIRGIVRLPIVFSP